MRGSISGGMAIRSQVIDALSAQIEGGIEGDEHRSGTEDGKS
jgi:hypothetical protein